MHKYPPFTLDQTIHNIDEELALQYRWVCPFCRAEIPQENTADIISHRERLTERIERWKRSAERYIHLIGKEITLQYTSQHPGYPGKHLVTNKISGFNSFRCREDLQYFCASWNCESISEVWLVLENLYVPNKDRDGWDREYYVVTNKIEASKIQSDLTVVLNFNFDFQDEWEEFIEELKAPSKMN